MNYQNNTKEVLIEALQKLQQEYDSLKTSYEKDITERKLSEEALRKSESRYRNLIDHAPVIIFIVDAEGNLLHVNLAGQKMLGYSEDELGRLKVVDTYPTDDMMISRRRLKLMRKMHAGEAMHFERLMRRKDGTLFPVEISVGALQDGTTHAIIRDITERKQAEEELRQSEMKLKTLFEVLPIGISILDAERNVAFVNPAMEKILRMTKDSFIRGDYKSRKYFRPDGTQMPQEELASVRAIREQRAILNVETGVLMEEGHVIWTNVNAAPVPFPDWKVVISTTDITDRKFAEEALHQSEARYRDLFETASDSIFIVDRTTGYIIESNPAASKRYGYSSEEFLRLKARDVSAEPEKTEDAISGNITEVPLRFHRRKDGTIFPVEISSSYFTQGGRKLYTAFIRDITERKRSEELIHESEEKFRTVADFTYDWEYWEGKEGQILYISPSCERISGYKPEQFLSDSLLLKKIIHPDDSKLFDDHFEKAHSVEDFQDIGELDFRIIKKDGSVVHVGHVCQPVIDYKSNYHGKRISNRDITKRKLAEEALRLEKENFRHSLDDSPLGVRIASADGNTIYANKTILDIYGYDNFEELQITPLKDRYTPESYRQSQKRKKQRKRGDESATDYEISIVRKNGEIRHLQVYRKEVLWYGVKQFQIIYNDITGRKQTEEALQESEIRYRELFNNISSGVAIYEGTDDGNDFIFKDFNSAGERIDGDRKEDIIGKSILQVRPGINKFGLLEVFKRVYATGIPEHYPARFYMDEKLQGWYNNFVYRIPSGEIVTVYDDITEQKQAEAALKESEARFRSLFENSLMGISITEIDGHLVQVNLAYAKMYGYKNPEEMLTEITNVRMLYANPVEREEILRILRRKGFMEAREVEVIRRDGSRFFDLISASEIRDSEGKLLYNQAIHIDVTDRRRNEREIKKSKELLEKLYQHLNEIREEERTSISREIHDQLGQSMTALKLDLSRMYIYLDNNTEAVAKLKGMIELVSDTIKNVQRISSDLRPGILDELGLVSAIEWYCDEFEKRTEIKCYLNLVNSDISDSQINLVFFRVLQETLTNVIRHAKASFVCIKLHQSERGLTLSVKDNGIGITKEQIESNRSLGLISMRERVKQFNGTIDISSKKDSGAKLTIFIPSVNS